MIAIGDIDRKIAAAQRVTRDSVTGLPNCDLFHDRLTQAMAVANRQMVRVGVLLVEVLDLENVYPESRRRELSIAIAGRLRESVRQSDTVARLDATSFGVVLTEIGSPDSTLVVAGKIQQRLTALLNEADMPATIAPQCAIGIVLFPNHALELAPLWKRATQALKQALAEGKSVCLYTPSVRETSMASPRRSYGRHEIHGDEPQSFG